jgi:hypothetical protein
MLLNFLQQQQRAELVLVRRIMNARRKIYKLMEEWVSHGNLIVTFITEDAGN